MSISKEESLAELKERLVWKEREVWWLTRKIGLLEREINEEGEC